MVLGNGQVMFDSLNRNTRSSMVHNIISESEKNLIDSTVKLPSSVLASSIGREREGSTRTRTAEDEQVENNGSEMVGTSFEGNYSSISAFRQVLPLLRRLHMEYPLKFQEAIELPVCYIILSVWGQFDTEASPIHSFVVRDIFFSNAVNDQFYPFAQNRFLLFFKDHNCRYRCSFVIVSVTIGCKLGSAKRSRLGYGRQAYFPSLLSPRVIDPYVLFPHRKCGCVIVDILRNLWLECCQHLGRDFVLDCSYDIKFAVWESSEYSHESSQRCVGGLLHLPVPRHCGLGFFGQSS